MDDCLVCEAEETVSKGTSVARAVTFGIAVGAVLEEVREHLCEAHKVLYEEAIHDITDDSQDAEEGDHGH